MGRGSYTWRKRRLGLNRCIGRKGSMGNEGRGVEARGDVATRGPQLSLLMTTVPRAEPCALIINVKTVQRRPFEFLPLSLKNVGGVFQTSSVVITLLSINTSKIYHF